MADNGKKYRVLSIVLACVQNMTLGGIFYGWASISGGLLISSTRDGGPGLSPDYVHMIFVIASFCNFLGPLVLGFILDSYGPRVCSVVSVLLITIGSVMFAVSDEHSMPLFIPAMCLIAFGGPGTQNAIIHLSNLFPEWKATATACIVGSFQLSFIVFLIFDQLWSTMRYSYSTLFSGYAVICVANVILSMVMWPDKPYQLEDVAPEIAAEEEVQEHSKAPRPPAPLIHMARIRLPSVMIHRHHPGTPTRYSALAQHAEHEHEHEHEHDHEQCNHLDDHQHGQSQSYHGAPPTWPEGEPPVKHSATTEVEPEPTMPAVDLKDASFNKQILSPEFLWLTFFFLVNSFWANFYIGTFDMQLGDKHSLTPELRHEFAQWFTMIITLGVLAIPPVGALMDRKGFPATSLVCICSGIIWAVLLMADSPDRHYLMLSFVFYSIYRTALFTFFFAYLADVLGFQFFGMLGGIIFLMAGVLGMLQYPLGMYAAGDCHIYGSDRSTCDHGRWKMVNMVMVSMVAVTVYFTYLDYIRRRAVQASAEKTVPSGALQLEMARPSYGAV